MKETPLTTDFAAVGRLSVGLRAAPVRYPSRRKKEDQDLREPRQNLRESRQNSRQTGHGLKESNEDFPMCGQALAESEARFRLLVECVADYAIYMLDPKGQVVTWNEGAERSKGYKAEEIQGKNYSIFFLPEDAKAGLPTRELMAEARDGRYETEAWRRRKDSTKFWALVTLTAIRGPEGELRGFAKVTRDMTAQKASEEVLRRQNAELERYRIIVENIVDYVIFTLDAEGRIDSWSPGVQELLGYTAEEGIGRRPWAGSIHWSLLRRRLSQASRRRRWRRRRATGIALPTIGECAGTEGLSGSAERSRRFGTRPESRPAISAWLAI